MKNVMMLRTPPPINQLGNLVKSNREEYCKQKGYEFIFDNSDYKDRHFSWALAYKILDILKDETKEFDWLFNASPEGLVGNFNMDVDALLEMYLEEDQDIFTIGEYLTPNEGESQPWFSNLLEKELKLISMTSPVFLICPAVLIIKRTDRAIKFFEDIVNDKRFMDNSVFDSMPLFIDRLQLAMTLYYQSYDEVKNLISVAPAKEITCMPKGSGYAYTKLKTIMRKVIKHEYANFHYGSPSITVWCLSGGVDTEVVTQIVEENKKYIMK